MLTARDIFSAAMSIMDELSAAGEAANSDTREYEQRTPAILNVLLTELAANLLVDENPTAASFYQQRYEELRALFVSRLKASVEDIDMLYGGVGEGRFARW